MARSQWLGLIILGVAALMPAPESRADWHRRGSARPNVPPYNTELFGYYSTQWRPWPISSPVYVQEIALPVAPSVSAPSTITETPTYEDLPPPKIQDLPPMSISPLPMIHSPPPLLRPAPESPVLYYPPIQEFSTIKPVEWRVPQRRPTLGPPR